MAALKSVLASVGLLTIVAAFQAGTVARAEISEDVPVPESVTALVHAIGIESIPDRGRFVSEITRITYDSEARTAQTLAFLRPEREASRATSAVPAAAKAGGLGLVPIPLNEQIWEDAILHRRVKRGELLAAILADRSAALLCHGLAALDDATLEFLVDHPPVLARLYERSAAAFAAFGESIHVVSGRVRPAGGEEAVPLWEAAVGEKVTRPDRFILALFEALDGRMAYLYDTVDQLDAPRRAFVFGSWMPDHPLRLERFRSLTSTTLMAAEHEWHVRSLPFGRAPYDLAMILSRVQVDGRGAPIEPAGRQLWARVFGLSEPPADTPIDAAWLIDAIGPVDVRQRSARLDQLAFAQRVLTGRPEAGEDTVFVLRSVPRYRALVLTLEQMGLREPGAYAAVIRHAARLTALDARRGFLANAQFQGALALVARTITAGTLTPEVGKRLVRSLAAVPLGSDGRYSGGIARWLSTELRPLLPPAKDTEAAVLAGLAGRSPEGDALRRITWEGHRYRLDPAAAEEHRLTRIREKQEAVLLDVPIQLSEAASLLSANAPPSVGDVRELSSQLAVLADDLHEGSRQEEAERVPAGVPVPSSAREALKRAADELSKAAARGADMKRAARVSEPLSELGDELLGRSLVSLAYAVDVGDPDGTVLLAGDVSRRHDFGYGQKDGDLRVRTMWSIPRQQVVPSTPWHVAGSLLGLDVGLASLSLRRVNSDHPLEAPRLNATARETFATSVSLMNPEVLQDRQRDIIAEAVDRGRRRVLAADLAELDTMAEVLSIDGARRRALHWTRAHEPERLPLMFSLTELLTAGGGKTAELHAWGMAVLPTYGCLCSRLLQPGTWETFAGRSQLGLAAAMVPDLNFRVAILLKELDLPARLAKVVLSAAVQDFVDEVRPTDDADWLTLSRTARDLSRERVEDYIAAATATGPLIPDVSSAPER